MNYLTLITFQRMIFSILFILSGLYLIIFLLKEIFMLFIPRKNSFDINELLINNKDIKIIPLTTGTQPEATVKKEITINKHIQPKVIKKEKYIKSPTTSPSVKVKKEKIKRKSRKRTHDI
jgi:hypothetical protein